MRLVAVDVDGTLLDSRQRVSERNAEALRRAAAGGTAIALATGRRVRFAAPIVAALALDCYLIACNGAVVCRPDGGELFRHRLPRRRARAVMAALAEFEAQLVITFDRDGPEELLMLAAEAADAAQTAARRRAFAGWLERNRAAVAYTAQLGDRLTEDPIQLMYGGTPAEVAAMDARLAARPIYRRVTCMRTIYPQRGLGIFDILDGGVSKGVALAALAAQMGLGREQVMAIGDNYNDLEMLEFAGTAAVMGNAHAEMRRPGWLWVADHDHDGVAEALERAGL